MKKKYLIVSGDSFTTDINFRSEDRPDMDVSWPKWPELLGKKLNMEVINLARSGQGNEYIYSTLHDEILNTPNKDEIGLVIAAWSQAQRHDWEHRSNWLKYINSRGYEWNDDFKTPEALKTRTWVAQPSGQMGDIVGWVHKSLRYFAALEMMCERHNIPYFQTQMIQLFGDYVCGRIIGQPEHGSYIRDGWPNDAPQFIDRFELEYKEILRLITKYDKILNTEKFIGWPNNWAFGGMPLNDMVFGDNILEKKLWTISDNDQHPNAAGHEKLAQYMYDRCNV
jgi:hypothetical protein